MGKVLRWLLYGCLAAGVLFTALLVWRALFFIGVFSLGILISASTRTGDCEEKVISFKSPDRSRVLLMVRDDHCQGAGGSYYCYLYLGEEGKTIRPSGPRESPWVFRSYRHAPCSVAWMDSHTVLVEYPREDFEDPNTKQPEPNPVEGITVQMKLLECESRYTAEQWLDP